MKNLRDFFLTSGFHKDQFGSIYLLITWGLSIKYYFDLLYDKKFLSVIKNSDDVNFMHSLILTSS